MGLGKGGLQGLDGLYITVEGLINNMRDHITKYNPFDYGDAATNYHISINGKENGGGKIFNTSSQYQYGTKISLTGCTPWPTARTCPSLSQYPIPCTTPSL